MAFLNRTQIVTGLILLLLIPVGFYSKLYRGPAHYWVNDSLSGVFYEIFWCLFFFLILPRARVGVIAVLVFLVTSSLEFLQLWQPAFLVPVRNNFFGQALIGNSFTWSDFPYYAAGCLLGWLLMKALSAGSKKSTSAPKR
jgi:hypothetical protein